MANTCGVGLVSMFRDKEDLYTPQDVPDLKVAKNPGGAGWLAAGFTNQRPEYKAAYDTLTKRYGAPVFQTPVRTNTRSGHKFFFAIWDTKGKK
jgi:hypothetical protein